MKAEVVKLTGGGLSVIIPVTADEVVLLDQHGGAREVMAEAIKRLTDAEQGWDGVARGTRGGMEA